MDGILIGPHTYHFGQVEACVLPKYLHLLEMKICASFLQYSLHNMIRWYMNERKIVYHFMLTKPCKAADI